MPWPSFSFYKAAQVDKAISCTWYGDLLVGLYHDAGMSLHLGIELFLLVVHGGNSSSTACVNAPKEYPQQKNGVEFRPRVAVRSQWAFVLAIMVAKWEASLSIVRMGSGNMWRFPSCHVDLEFETEASKFNSQQFICTYQCGIADVITATRRESPMLVTWSWQRERHLHPNCLAMTRVSSVCCMRLCKVLVLRSFAAPLLECTHEYGVLSLISIPFQHQRPPWPPPVQLKKLISRAFCCSVPKCKMKLLTGAISELLTGLQHTWMELLLNEVLYSHCSHMKLRVGIPFALDVPIQVMGAHLLRKNSENLILWIGAVSSNVLQLTPKMVTPWSSRHGVVDPRVGIFWTQGDFPFVDFYAYTLFAKSVGAGHFTLSMIRSQCELQEDIDLQLSATCGCKDLILRMAMVCQHNLGLKVISQAKELLTHGSKVKWLTTSIMEPQLNWDPGGFVNSGLGASRISSGGECHVPGRVTSWAEGWLGYGPWAHT
ncbi:unnamed protein product [Urochloa humidicola]